METETSTGTEALTSLFEVMTAQEAQPVYLDLLNDEDCADMKAMTTSSDLYFYLTLCMEPPSTEQLVQAQEIMYLVATTVRQDSR
jgi:hypothetical protein